MTSVQLDNNAATGGIQLDILGRHLNTDGCRIHPGIIFLSFSFTELAMGHGRAIGASPP